MSDVDEPETPLEQDPEVDEDDDDSQAGGDASAAPIPRLTKYAALIAYCGAGYQGFQM